MTVSASTVWEFRTTAAGVGMTGGGGFVTGATGTDFSQQDAIAFALTGVTSAGAGSVFLSASAAASWVGNICHVISGTNFTAGWFEILSVVVGVSATVGVNGAGTAITTGVGANGVINIGGALDLTGALPDSFFEQVTAGNLAYVKSGAYSLGSAISVASTLCTTTSPFNLIGYNATRTDEPTGANRPSIDCTTFAVAFGQAQNFRNLIFTGTASTLLATGTSADVRNVKATNTSTTAARAAVTSNTVGSFFNCEFVSQNGVAFSLGGASGTTTRIVGCYIHDSDSGIVTTSPSNFIYGNLIESCKTIGINSGSTSIGSVIANNTLYGSEAKIGTAILYNANGILNKLYNNIFYGFTAGIIQTTAQQACNSGAYNNFFNNTTDVTLYTKDVTDFATNPGFVGASQITGSNASTSGSVLTSIGADFSTVTDNVDYCRIVSGTGKTAGIYLINSHTTTTLTLNNAPGTNATTDGVFVVPIGHNFAVGTALKATGFPGAYSGSETTSYIEVGAIQRQEVSGSSSISGM